MTWEYKIVDLETKGFFLVDFDAKKAEDELNQLGDQNWELVTVATTSSHTGRSLSNVLIFKRPRASR
jgi:hypothetical protein